MRYFSTFLVLSVLALVAVSATLPAPLKERMPSYAINSAVAGLFRPEFRFSPGVFRTGASATPADSAATAFNILLFNYSVYDDIYVSQMHHFLERELPGATIADFKDESPERLERLLDKQQAVVITYPSGGDAEVLTALGKKLDQFIRNGGLVIITGTHQSDAIQSLGLLSPEETSYSDHATVQQKKADHPVLKGIQGAFQLSNFVYPMEFSDTDFTTLAASEGAPVVGYKDMGEGKVVYLGLEYYTDEAIPSTILGNIFKWALTAPASHGPVVVKPNISELAARNVKRTEELLYAGSVPKFDLKIYPNPYLEKASLEINIEKAINFSAEMTNETGSIAAVLLPQRLIAPGFYRLDIPDLEAGIYFVKCKFGNHIEVRKVVKMARN